MSKRRYQAVVLVEAEFEGGGAEELFFEDIFSSAIRNNDYITGWRYAMDPRGDPYTPQEVGFADSLADLARGDLGKERDREKLEQAVRLIRDSAYVGGAVDGGGPKICLPRGVWIAFRELADELVGSKVEDET